MREVAVQVAHVRSGMLVGGNKQATIRTPCTHLGCFGFLLDLMVLGDLLLLFVFCIFRILSDSLEFIGIL